MRKTGRYWRLQAFTSLCILAANLVLASWSVHLSESIPHSPRLTCTN
jgi:hypothetical protein